MQEKTFKLDIVTPRKVIFSDQVSSFSAPGTLGGFQVLYSHAPLLSSVVIGPVKVIEKTGQELRFATSGGFVEVRENKVVMLAETAERIGEIDIERAQAAKERALKRVEKKEPGTDIDRARIALQRALNRLRIAGKE